jgi:hypothetical protein
MVVAEDLEDQADYKEEAAALVVTPMDRTNLP